MACDELAEGLGLSIGDRARFGAHALGKQRDRLGVESIGLGQPTLERANSRICRGLTTANGSAAAAGN